MSIVSYEKNGKTYYEIFVCVRSKVNSKIRKQKRKNGFESKAQALKHEKLLLQECALEVAKLDGEGFYWGQIVEKWHAYKLVDKFEPVGIETLTDYLAALKTWTKDQWDKPAKHFSRADVKNVLKSIEEANKSKSFQAKMKGTINRVFTWAMEEGLIRDVYQSPTLGIKVNRKTERVPTILNRQEISKLIDAARELESPWYPIWATALLTGCRNGELFALTWEDVDFTNNSIRVSKSYNKRLRVTKSTKAGYWRNIPINSDLKELLLELKNNSTKEHVLPRIRDWCQGYQARSLKTFCQGIGITPIRFHDLRACFATQLLQNKVAPATVMKICGWKELDTMARYIRLAGIDESGATDSLQILSTGEASQKVVSIYRG
ncbi:MAG: site-specific integrase [Bacteriovoracaceae bacterium]|jgi:integrase|nr:site-specific integrase [Bacteriovoracaceae bacterium]